MLSCSIFKDAPTIDVYPRSSIAVEGNNITLSCNASGKPEPVIAWSKVGESTVLSQASSLTVTNVRRPETPENLIQYQCKASNGVESPATAIVNITVHCKYHHYFVLFEFWVFYCHVTHFYCFVFLLPPWQFYPSF